MRIFKKKTYLVGGNIGKPWDTGHKWFSWDSPLGEMIKLQPLYAAKYLLGRLWLAIKDKTGLK